jgi:hypothetical protein
MPKQVKKNEVSKKVKYRAKKLGIRQTTGPVGKRIKKTERELKRDILKKKKETSKKKKWTNKDYCKKLLGKQIAINTMMYNKKNKYSSRGQAIAVAFSQVKKDLKDRNITYCNKWLKFK